MYKLAKKIPPIQQQNHSLEILTSVHECKKIANVAGTSKYIFQFNIMIKIFSNICVQLS